MRKKPLRSPSSPTRHFIAARPIFPARPARGARPSSARCAMQGRRESGPGTRSNALAAFGTDASKRSLGVRPSAYIDTIAVGLLPRGIAITADGARAYVPNSRSGTLSVIDVATHTVVASIEVGIFPSGVALTP